MHGVTARKGLCDSDQEACYCCCIFSLRDVLLMWFSSPLSGETVFCSRADRMGGDRLFVCVLWLKKKKKNLPERTQLCVINFPAGLHFFSTITVAFLTIFCPCWDRLADISLILNLLHSHQLIVQNCAEPVKDLDASQQIWSPNFLEAISPSFWGSAKSTFWGWTESRGCGCQEYYVGRSETGDNELESCHAKTYGENKTSHECSTQNGRGIAH